MKAADQIPFVFSRYWLSHRWFWFFLLLVSIGATKMMLLAQDQDFANGFGFATVIIFIFIMTKKVYELGLETLTVSNKCFGIPWFWKKVPLDRLNKITFDSRKVKSNPVRREYFVSAWLQYPDKNDQYDVIIDQVRKKEVIQPIIDELTRRGYRIR